MKRVRAFAAWIGSFTFACCCCTPFIQDPKPGQDGGVQQQMEQKKSPDDKTDGDDGKKKSAKEERISRANFNKIQDNMTIKEVQAILGPGTEPATKAKAAIRQFMWRGTGERQQIRITVTFDQGRMTNKTMVGDD